MEDRDKYFVSPKTQIPTYDLFFSRLELNLSNKSRGFLTLKRQPRVLHSTPICAKNGNGENTSVDVCHHLTS